MKRIASVPMWPAAERALFTIGITVALLVCLAVPGRADSRRSSEASDQFARAVKMRTMLEGYLERDRSLEDYKKTIAAYHKVYLITPLADDATSALIAEAELYQEMGRLYGPKYFESAIDAYDFLLAQYPGSRYRGDALLAIAQIQKGDLDEPEDAQDTYEKYLKLFPHSEKASAARADLKEIADRNKAAEEKQPDELPDLDGQHVEPRIADGETPEVKGIQSWNAENSTRVVVALGNTIKFKATRIASPDRIFFDLYNARLNPAISTDGLASENGLLKSVRIAQNKPNAVRVVLDVSGAKDYSAYLLANPYRLVIEVHAPQASMAKNTGALAAAPPTAAKGSTAKLVASEPLDATEEVPASTAGRGPSVPLPATPVAKAGTKMISLPPKTSPAVAIALGPAPVPKPTRDGQRSLTRVLGLKISRIVIDPGHGGHDTGTIGPHGLMEKDVCLDVALSLGRLIEEKLPGAQVIYTRKDDTFVPLEERNAIANQAKADLFISIHANSSHDPGARGVETYYLNFASSEESMEVAARENANSQESLHDLQDLIKKIARNDKIEESKELADDIQDALSQRLQLVSRTERNRGVKKAPFIVLIGASMPSVLSEISFLSNPNDERLLRKPEQRQRIADGLYRGIAAYLKSLNSLSYDKQKVVSDDPDSRMDVGAVASTGNPK